MANALENPMDTLKNLSISNVGHPPDPAITNPRDAAAFINAQRVINPYPDMAKDRAGGGGSDAYSDDSAPKEKTSGNGEDYFAPNTNFDRFMPQNPVSPKMTGEQEAVFYGNMAKNILNTAGLLSSIYDKSSYGTGKPSALTKTLGVGGEALGYAKIGYDMYKAFTGTQQEKERSYGSLGMEAATGAAKAYIGLDAAATSLANAGSTGATAGASSLASFASLAGGTILPWYAVTQLAGTGGQMVVQANEGLKNTPFDYMSESASEPLSVERSSARQLAKQGFGAANDLEKGSNTLNPIGAGVEDAKVQDWWGAGESLNKGLLNQVTAGLPNILEDKNVQNEMAKREDIIRDAELIPTPLGIPVPSSWVPDWVPIPGCFLADTMVEMADGTSKAIQDIELLDECLEGGTVTGIGVVLSQDLYDYNGIKVTGCHAVCEDGWWYRVEDAHQSIKLDSSTHKVYIVNNNLHKLIINDILFADFSECEDSVNMTAKERIDYLNANLEV